MTGLNLEYLYSDELKSKIHKMSNDVLITEWKNVRLLNNYCLLFDFSHCQICTNRNSCLNYLIYEEILTEEIENRGLLHFAIISSCHKNTEKFGRVDLEQNTLLDLDQINSLN